MQLHRAVNVIPKTRFKSSQYCVTMQPEFSFMHNDNHQVSKSKVSLINQDVAILIVRAPDCPHPAVFFHYQLNDSLEARPLSVMMA